MTQWLRKKIISFMGKVYVWLDRGLQHETSPILGTHIEKKFGWEKDSFWELESTQKIRLCCQTARGIMSKGEEE